MIKHFISCTSHRKALIFLIISAVLWSTGGLFVKLIQWHPLAIAGVRSLIAVVLIAGIYGKYPVSYTTVEVGGAIGYSAMVTFFVIATKLTTAANAILLQYTAPIYVAILAGIFLKEKTTKIDWLSIAGVVVGMFLFFIEEVTMGNLLGNLCGIASGIGFATFVICLRRQRDGKSLHSVLLGNTITFIIGLPFIFRNLPDWLSWAGLIYLGTMQLGISYVFYTNAVARVSALEAVMVPVIEPVMNPIWVLLLIGEMPGKWPLVGGFVILSSVLGKYLWSLKHGKQAECSAAANCKNICD